jgi:hypothetical protein
MPPSARKWGHPPTAHYREASVGIGPSDRSFTRTTWWTVPLSREGFGTWLHAHAPHGLRADSDSGGVVESMGVWERDQDFHARGTTAHTEGWVNFAFMPQGDALVVRVDTFVGARFARTVLVPKDSTFVTIRRTARTLAADSRPHTTVRTITDPKAVADLVGMVDELPGAMTKPVLASCPETVTQQSYTMAFATPHGTFVARLPTTACWPSLTLMRDGAKAGPLLDPGQLFTKAADHYLE